MEKTKKPFNPMEFKIKSRFFLAIICIVGAFAMMAFAMFNETAAASKYTGTIVGFLTGSVFMGILTYFFDGNQNQGGEDYLSPELKPTHQEPLKKDLGKAKEDKQ